MLKTDHPQVFFWLEDVVNFGVPSHLERTISPTRCCSLEAVCLSLITKVMSRWCNERIEALLDSTFSTVKGNWKEVSKPAGLARFTVGLLFFYHIKKRLTSGIKWFLRWKWESYICCYLSHYRQPVCGKKFMNTAWWRVTLWQKYCQISGISGNTYKWI